MFKAFHALARPLSREELRTGFVLCGGCASGCKPSLPSNARTVRHPYPFVSMVARDHPSSNRTPLFTLHIR